MNPKALCRAVAYHVLLDFVALVSDRQWLPSDKADAHRQRLQDIFDPAPLPPPTAPRRAEDADVFLEKLKLLLIDHPDQIVPLGKPYARPQRGKVTAAWRQIGGEEYLVMEEKVSMTWYAKAVKADRTIDATFLQNDRWAAELQKLLGQAGVIKIPASGYRYRYDLLANGTRDTTYVVATPARLLLEGGQKAGQNAPPPANSIARFSAEIGKGNDDDLRKKGVQVE